MGSSRTLARNAVASRGEFKAIGDQAPVPLRPGLSLFPVNLKSGFLPFFSA